MISSKSELTIFKQLIQAQPEFDKITKNKTAKVGANFSYQYANLAQVLAVVVPILNKNNLFLTQFPRIENGQFTLDTFIANEAGEQLQLGSIAYQVNGLTPQDVGKIITYMRRYSILCAFGLATEDDDAAGLPQTPSNKHPAPTSKGTQGLLQEIDKSNADILKNLVDLYEIKKDLLLPEICANMDALIMNNDIVRAKSALEYLKGM